MTNKIRNSFGGPSRNRRTDRYGGGGTRVQRPMNDAITDGTHRRHLANTSERPVRGGDAASRQIAFAANRQRTGRLLISVNTVA